MLRAGLIRRLASGLYSWLPVGIRVLRKVEAIVREEMDRAGALELLMLENRLRRIYNTGMTAAHADDQPISRIEPELIEHVR